MGDFAFDEDTRVVAAGSSGGFAAELTGRWNGTAGAVNGGYMLAICTRFVSHGYHEEDFEVWDSAGTLVAQSRQLAMVLPAAGPAAG